MQCYSFLSGCRNGLRHPAVPPAGSVEAGRYERQTPASRASLSLQGITEESVPPAACLWKSTSSNALPRPGGIRAHVEYS